MKNDPENRQQETENRGRLTQHGEKPKAPEAWEIRLMSEIRAEIEDRRHTWGETDEALLAAYADGVCTPDEVTRVEQAMGQYPAVRELVDYLKKSIEEERAIAHPETETPANDTSWEQRLSRDEKGPGKVFP